MALTAGDEAGSRAGESILRTGNDREWLVRASPVAVYTATDASRVPALLRDVESRVESEQLLAVGFLSYESAAAFDAAYPVAPSGDFPLAWFALYRETSGAPLDPFVTAEGGFRIGEWTPTIGREEYLRAVESIRNRIREGDTYQVNFSYRLRAPFSGDTFSFFRALARNQETPYAAYIDTGRYVVCSVSPELFFRLDAGTLTSRPMKGTARRGLWTEDDRLQGESLRQSAKDRAENVMIVDMVRNDIGRVAEKGSVLVSDLCALEKYPTVWQLTSTVTGRTVSSLTDILPALFPAASITGAPRASTMRIIRELESTPRNLYTGAIGWLRPGGRASFSVAIRTAVIDRDRGEAEYGVGGGITWGSRGTDEYDETRAKALVLGETRGAFQLLETMLWTPDAGFSFLDEHMARLEGSAGYFSYVCSPEKTREALRDAAGRWPAVPHRVRLLLSKQGMITVDGSPLGAPESAPRPRVRLARTPVSSKDVFLYHKTTNRRSYEEARATTPDCDDVILWNERGEVTESTIANIVVERGGRLLTPLLSSGLLPGICRESLLRTGAAEERILVPDDLLRAEHIYCCNSVRGRYEVQFIGTAV
jgi:para-aminobenzoate synthetase / 4-amino-4-deoxychorismate lyase